MINDLLRPSFRLSLDRVESVYLSDLALFTNWRVKESGLAAQRRWPSTPRLTSPLPTLPPSITPATHTTTNRPPPPPLLSLSHVQRRLCRRPRWRGRLPRSVHSVWDVEVSGRRPSWRLTFDLLLPRRLGRVSLLQEEADRVGSSSISRLWDSRPSRLLRRSRSLDGRTRARMRATARADLGCSPLDPTRLHREAYDDFFKAYSTVMMASRSERANLVHGGKSQCALTVHTRSSSGREARE